VERVAPDLASAIDLVTARGLTLGRPLHLLATTTSTNDEAKRGAHSGAPHGTTWVAEEQSAGRGRQGRSWLGTRGESLLFSVLLRPDCAPARLPLLSIVAGLCVRDAVARAGPEASVKMKWPNDVVQDRGALPFRKVAGVLVEAITSGGRVEAAVVGVGINVHTRDFPPDIADRAVSVSMLSPGEAPDRANILADVLAGLDRDAHVVLHRGLGLLRAHLDASDALRGRIVRNTGEGPAVVGRADGIDDEGRLVVRPDQPSDAVFRWNAGEVHLV
jgi:BirA family biotin operon repressor/biotin-[acetyl-CoA-carboxylase] ligase